jgi:V8-like Glu-specific endopeptidase
MPKSDTSIKELRIPGKEPSEMVQKYGHLEGTVTYKAPSGITFLDMSKEFILQEDPNKRYRLIGTAPRGTIKRPVVKDEHDNRVRINNTTDWPWRVNGLCTITYPDKVILIGSGTMVNRHHVLTAGHVVYDPTHGGWATSIQFTAALNETTLPYGSALSTTLLSFTGWTANNDADWDMGMIILNTELGDQTGWMGVIVEDDINLAGHDITIAGYPGDKGGQQMWAATGGIGQVNTNQIFYYAYTKGGQSGAGVFGTWEGFSGEHQCATHTRGPNGVPNTGCRVTGDKYKTIKDWLTK